MKIKIIPKLIYLLLVISILLFGCLSSPTGVSKEEANTSRKSTRQKPKWRVDILSSSHYIDEEGFYHVVGEVKNNTGRRVEYTRINATFYDRQKREIDTGFTYLDPPRLEAGQKVSFDVTNRNRETSTSIVSYKLEVTYEVE